ncbi:GMC oxidoreductase [Martelella mediterranea]|uniref:6'''-hydroxyparomomycin C oxidase n=1 Tax=Martelella mediterranea DSM 17316 TaxID=1122214 RepID=A0A1U9YXW3_9HYPH|nr:GMC family oxidoreductase [Martelella mediterranea]AQZ50230.1 6'''-hydroxyparomomycin C oxidase [Martelella mediterranea DSM 17316]
MRRTPDVVIIGSGMGGATLAASLAPTGADILILERGHQIPDDAPARDPDRIYRNSAFRSDETWLDETGKPFSPGNYYNVGGNTKLYGAVLYRYRRQDFQAMEHLGGISPAWPFPYETLAPYYDAAEALYQVRGDFTEDPTEPPHAGPYPYPAVPDEPALAAVRRRLEKAGLHPAALPLGVDLDRWLSHGNDGWDGYPDTRSGKMDAETCGLAAALSHNNARMETGARVTHMTAAPDRGRIASVTYEQAGETVTVTPKIVALAAGAVQTAALLLKSGLANSSGAVGRHFMNHNATAMIAYDPRFHNDAVYQKTFAINDWYLADGDNGPPLGNVQLLGRVVPKILKATTPSMPMALATHLSRHSVDFYAISEDLPDPESRVVLNGNDIQLLWRRSNMEAHNRLVKRMKQALRRAGFPVVLSRLFDGRVPSHQCGTARLGDDPATAVLDPDCRSFDHDNLYVTDASALPTSAAVNPSLTVAALALKAGDAIKRELAS